MSQSTKLTRSISSSRNQCHRSIWLIAILLLIQLTGWNLFLPNLMDNVLYQSNNRMHSSVSSSLDGTRHHHQGMVDAFIFWKATTTACDICDGIDTNSGRNLMCCLLQSKCCGFKTLDEAEEIRANETAAAALT